MKRSTFLLRLLGLAVAGFAVSAPVLATATTTSPDTRTTAVAEGSAPAAPNGFSWG